MAVPVDPARSYQTRQDGTGPESGQGSDKDAARAALARSVVRLKELGSDFDEALADILASLERGDERLAAFGLRVLQTIACDIDRVVREEIHL